ncbi:hypothetical protein BKA70DRAFT_1451760 [Coprinopsis sp. MPI-PUGE-AT-0042]|nr:hypothetical protein BKA70DRAFT_1451760 [Coprinopsis sp. MPI-PUGE-AT-0042]
MSTAPNVFLVTSACAGVKKRTHILTLDEALLEGPQGRLLHSEHEPSGEEKVSSLHNILQRRFALDDLKSLSATLHAYQQKLERALDLYEGVISPIRRLPDDLLQEIFARLSVGQAGRIIILDPNRVSQSKQEPPPLVLERVCSRWLRLIRSTVELWTDLKYEYLPDDPDDWVPLMAFTDRLLAQSKDAPLTMAFFPQSSDFSATAKAAQALHPGIFDKLVQSTERWRELCANPGSIASLQAVGIIPSVLPMLKTIDLAQCWWKPMAIAADLEHHVQLLHLPILHTIFVANMIKPGAPSSYNYDFIRAPSLKHLDVTEFSYSRLSFPTFTTYSLDTLTLTLNDQDNRWNPFPTLPSELRFPDLKTLHVQTRNGRKANGIPWVLRALVCPSLAVLAIGATDHEKGLEDVNQALSDFISRSGCQIEELTLSKIPPVELMLSSAATEDVNELTGSLESYQLRSLFIRVERFSERAELLLSVPALRNLLNADMWMKTPEDPARVRLEFRILLDNDAQQELDEFCRGTLLSSIHCLAKAFLPIGSDI